MAFSGNLIAVKLHSNPRRTRLACRNGSDRSLLQTPILDPCRSRANYEHPPIAAKDSATTDRRAISQYRLHRWLYEDSYRKRPGRSAWGHTAPDTPRRWSTRHMFEAHYRRARSAFFQEAGSPDSLGRKAGFPGPSQRVFSLLPFPWGSPIRSTGLIVSPLLASAMARLISLKS
jgi:hypothetical protein